MFGSAKRRQNVVDLAATSNAAPPVSNNFSGDTDIELAAFRQMVDSMPINVMTLDLQDFTINYVNKTSVETLKKLEHLLPCKADDLQGQCVDIFHKAPEHQRQLLADPKNLPHRARITLGDEVLALFVSPIFDTAGHYVAPMLTWSIVTEKVRADKYALDAEAIKPYFSLENVRNGAFDVAGKLYGIRFEPVDNIPVYHEDVEAFEVFEKAVFI